MLKLASSILLMLPMWAWGNAELFNLKSDKTSYIPHEKAMLVTNVTTLPSSPNYEVVIQSEVNSQTIEAIKLSENKYISEIDDVGGAGAVTFTSKYFMRDKHQADEYERAVGVSDLKILDLIRERRNVTAAERVAIDAQIAVEEGKVTYYRGKLNGLLRLVETRNLVATVVPAVKSLESAFIFLTPERESGVYHPGELLTLFGHVYLQVSDKESVVKASMNGNPLEVERLINDEFVIRSGELSTGDVGNKTVAVSLLLRDKIRSGKLVEALAAIEAETLRLNQELETENDPVEIAAIMSQLQKLSLVKTHIESILLGLEQQVESVNYKFVVESV